MIKIIAASDNHGYLDPIKEILDNNNTADYYLHMGDVCCDPKLIHPFVAVKGNNDFGYDLPVSKVIEVNDKNRILMTHGHHYVFDKSKILTEAKEQNCNIVLFGHTHTFTDKEIDGIRIINPGSCFYNRDHSKPCYAEITIDETNNIEVKRVDITSLIF